MAEQEEQAGALSNATQLTVPEVLVLFDDYIARNKAQEPDYQPNHLLQQAAEYARRIASTNSSNRESVQKMREVLMYHNHFTSSEAAAVINLQIGTADEARKLIPTLNSNERFTDEELDRILAEVGTYRDLA